jgi:hypothetical protein
MDKSDLDLSSSGAYARPNLDELANATEPREMGRGGGEVPASKKGPGVRAADLSRQGETHIILSSPLVCFKDRIRGYREVLEMVMDGKDDSAKDTLDALYERFKTDFMAGRTFLSHNQIMLTLNQLVASGILEPEEQNMWEETLVIKIRS